MSAIQIEGPPVAEPVTLDEVKSHCRVTLDDDDALLKLYVQAAREDVEAFLARSLINKRYRQSLDSFPYYTDTTFSQMAYPPSYYSLPRYSTTLWNYSQMVKLFVSPLVSVDRISYLSSGDSAWHDLLPAPFSWEADTVFELGDEIEDPTGHLQEVTDSAKDSKSGKTTPSWSVNPGAVTNDRALVWTCRGLAPTGDFIYDADSEPPRIFPLPGQFWPSVLYVPNAVVIHYTAGYGDNRTDVPGLAKLGILHTVAAWYENREPISAANLKIVPAPIENLLWALRVLDLAPTRG